MDSGRPIAHVAAEAGRSRGGAWPIGTPAGLSPVLLDFLNHSSTPNSSPGQTDPEVEHLVEMLRRQTKYGAGRFTARCVLLARRSPAWLYVLSPCPVTGPAMWRSR